MIVLLFGSWIFRWLLGLMSVRPISWDAQTSGPTTSEAWVKPALTRKVSPNLQTDTLHKRECTTRSGAGESGLNL